MNTFNSIDGQKVADLSHEELSILKDFYEQLRQPVLRELKHYKQAYTSAYDAQSIARNLKQKYEAMTSESAGSISAVQVLSFATAARQTAKDVKSKHNIAIEAEAAQKFVEARAEYRSRFQTEGIEKRNLHEVDRICAYILLHNLVISALFLTCATLPEMVAAYSN